VLVQTVRHRESFAEDSDAADPDDHATPPSERAALGSLLLLVVALVAVVGLAKVESPAIEDGVDAIGAPQSAVGVMIALLVLLPETLAAVRNALGGRVQSSFNLALGSAIASIGLTIPAIAVASIWLDERLVLGLGATQMVLLAITTLVGALTVLPGRATVQEGGVHLVLFGAFLFPGREAVSVITPGARPRGRASPAGLHNGPYRALVLRADPAPYAAMSAR
jgi:Ca2+:H+ antiporter